MVVHVAPRYRPTLAPKAMSQTIQHAKMVYAVFALVSLPISKADWSSSHNPTGLQRLITAMLMKLSHKIFLNKLAMPN
jgi:hypothetical protein